MFCKINYITDWSGHKHVRRGILEESGKKRTCGDCIVCCVYPRIKELNKKGLTHCSNLNLIDPIQRNTLQYSSHDCGNCKIYNDRPEPCKQYSCLWLQGFGLEEDRPDRSFILADTTHSIDNAIECKPLSEEAVTSEKSLDTVIRLSRETGRVALLTTFYETKIARVIGKPI